MNILICKKDLMLNPFEFNTVFALKKINAPLTFYVKKKGYWHDRNSK